MILITPQDAQDIIAALDDRLAELRHTRDNRREPEVVAANEAHISRCMNLQSRIVTTLGAWDGSDASWCSLLRDAAEQAAHETATPKGQNEAFADVRARMDEELMA